MQTQVRTTFRNWFSPPTLCELRIELISSGWLQASSPDEPSHLPKSHFFFPTRRWIPLPRTTMWRPTSKKCGDLQLPIVPANLISHGSFVMVFNIPSPALTHVFPCCGASAEVSAAPGRALSRLILKCCSSRMPSAGLCIYRSTPALCHSTFLVYSSSQCSLSCEGDPPTGRMCSRWRCLSNYAKNLAERLSQQRHTEY